MVSPLPVGLGVSCVLSPISQITVLVLLWLMRVRGSSISFMSGFTIKAALGLGYTVMALW